MTDTVSILVSIDGVFVWYSDGNFRGKTADVGVVTGGVFGHPGVTSRRAWPLESLGDRSSGVNDLMPPHYELPAGSMCVAGLHESRQFPEECSKGGRRLSAEKH